MIMSKDNICIIKDNLYNLWFYVFMPKLKTGINWILNLVFNVDNFQINHQRLSCIILTLLILINCISASQLRKHVTPY